MRGATLQPDGDFNKGHSWCSAPAWRIHSISRSIRGTKAHHHGGARAIRGQDDFITVRPERRVIDDTTGRSGVTRNSDQVDEKPRWRICRISSIAYAAGRNHLRCGYAFRRSDDQHVVMSIGKAACSIGTTRYELSEASESIKASSRGAGRWPAMVAAISL